MSLQPRSLNHVNVSVGVTYIHLSNKSQSHLARRTPYLDGLPLKVSDQILNQTQRLFIERQLFQVPSHETSDDCRVGSQAELFSARWLRTKQEPQVSEMCQAILDQAKPAHRELSRGYIQCSALMFGQKALQDISQRVALVIYDIGELHVWRRVWMQLKRPNIR